MLLSHAKKEAKAEQFEYDLIAEIYSNYQMHPLWVKFQNYVKLPVKDNENVAFDESINDSDFDRLKYFITDFEEKMSIFNDDGYFTRISFITSRQ